MATSCQWTLQKVDKFRLILQLPSLGVKVLSTFLFQKKPTLVFLHKPIRVHCASSQTRCRRCERIHEEPGGEEHADGQQNDGEVGEHSRVHRAGVSGHCLQFLQRNQRGKHELVKRRHNDTVKQTPGCCFDIAAQCVLCVFERQMPLKAAGWSRTRAEQYMGRLTEASVAPLAWTVNSYKRAF